MSGSERTRHGHHRSLIDVPDRATIRQDIQHEQRTCAQEPVLGDNGFPAQVISER
jgi:hypothetical protein